MAAKAKYVKLGEQLRYYRKLNGFTQKQIADLTGLSRPTISAYEQGTAEPDMATFRKMAAAYKVSADVLLDLEKPEMAFAKNEICRYLTETVNSLLLAAESLETVKTLVSKL